MSTFWIETVNKAQDGKVLLWERHPNHPNGEVYIANDGVQVEVDETPAVKQLLDKGLIRKVSYSSMKATPPKEVLATDENEDDVIARVEEALSPLVKAVPNGGINRGGRPQRGR